MNPQVNEGDEPRPPLAANNTPAHQAARPLADGQGVPAHLAANALLTALHHGQVRTFADVHRLGLLDDVDPAEVAFGIAVQMVTVLKLFEGRGLNVDKMLAGIAQSAVNRAQTTTEGN